MWEDPIVADVHRIREELAAKFNFNIKAIFADMRIREAGVDNLSASAREAAIPLNGQPQELPVPEPEISS